MDKGLIEHQRGRLKTASYDTKLPKTLIRMVEQGHVTSETTITIFPNRSWREWLLDGVPINSFQPKPSDIEKARQREIARERVRERERENADKIVVLHSMDDIDVGSYKNQRKLYFDPEPRPEPLPDLDPDDLLTSQEVCDMLKVSLSTLHRLRRHPDFPEPIEFNSRTKRWSKRAMQVWIDNNRDKLIGLLRTP